eukprot:tig00021434_g21303.t1
MNPAWLGIQLPPWSGTHCEQQHQQSLGSLVMKAGEELRVDLSKLKLNVVPFWRRGQTVSVASCGMCGGVGSKPCHVCEGAGISRATGSYGMMRCHRCRGEGALKCPRCGGKHPH